MPGEKQAATESVSGCDQVTLSQEGQAAVSGEALADKVAAQLGCMTKEDFMCQLEQWQSENQKPLEVDPYWSVDPDGTIATKTYFESYIGQLTEQENTIKDYYAAAYKEAVSAPINSLAFISGKYLCDWSDYYDSSMPVKERQWTHRQLWAMLTDTHVALNDPYALASVGGPKTVEQMDRIARQAVKDKLDFLLQENRESV
ncbi:MAG: hypothetical protein NC211_07580 [Alistipes senegalensis]|nr:hypothetical protein [Oxalobacter formigenes]MCM1281669.1 hypothetical protein [Alistipes senegalensis]